MDWILLLSISFLSVAAQERTTFECDHIFDAKHDPREFSFPLLPKTPTDSFWQQNISSATNLQCLYSFVAGQRERVRLEFDHFKLAGSSESCESEYVDVYSELENPQTDLLSAPLAGRYCGSVAPQVIISLHNVLVLVFHSRARERNREFGFSGRYSFISDDVYQPGTRLPGTAPCAFLIEPTKKKRGGMIYSPTYPGTYPKNFHCSYHLKGKSGQRIRLLFRDFDIYFGGEHCPYDSVTIFDGPTSSSPIIKKVCGLQHRMEVFSVGPDMLIHFVTTNSAKADPRGFVIEYEFSSKFVDVSKLLGGESGVTHMRGSECDVRVESNKETFHYIHSPEYPNLYPANTTCSYILDGLQGVQNLERVIVTFESLAVISDDAVGAPGSDDLACPYAWVGVAVTDGNMKSALSSTDDSNFDITICDRIPPGSPRLGPFVSEGPRMVIQFGTSDRLVDDGLMPMGFKAKVEFKTDFGVPGEPMGTSNECLFKFRSSTGFFNSPRYPANYPLDTNCTYFIEGQPGQQILVHFEQFALFEERGDGRCNDWVEIYDVFQTEQGQERLQLQERYCSETFPGPTVSAFGAHAIRVIFFSDSSGTGNGFKALYEIRKAPAEDIPSIERSDHRHDGPMRCGRRIITGDENPTGFIISPNFPIKYVKDMQCDWEVVARPGHQILLNVIMLDIEGEMTEDASSCQKAVLRVSGAPRTEYCGQADAMFVPYITRNNSVRISFLTSPDKVNGLKGFNMTWTEVRQVKDMSECSDPSEYHCTYSNLCISAQLRCNSEHNCGHQDDTDEAHCELKKSSADQTIIVAVIFCGGIFAFICATFFYLFKKKLERRRRKARSHSHHRQRQPYRSHKPKQPHLHESELPSPATSRFVHHDATGILPPVNLQPANPHQHTFFG